MSLGPAKRVDEADFFEATRGSWELAAVILNGCPVDESYPGSDVNADEMSVGQKLLQDEGLDHPLQLASTKLPKGARDWGKSASGHERNISLLVGAIGVSALAIFALGARYVIGQTRGGSNIESSRNPDESKAIPTTSPVPVQSPASMRQTLLSGGTISISTDTKGRPLVLEGKKIKCEFSGYRSIKVRPKDYTIAELAYQKVDRADQSDLKVCLEPLVRIVAQVNGAKIGDKYLPNNLGEVILSQTPVISKQ